MSIGKDSITKRVAKVDTSAQNTDVSSQSEQVETIVPAKKQLLKSHPQLQANQHQKLLLQILQKKRSNPLLVIRRTAISRK